MNEQRSKEGTSNTTYDLAASVSFISMTFFQTYFDGDQQNSPKRDFLPILPSLLQKTMQMVNKNTIIHDNDYYPERVSVVALWGINYLKAAYHLNQRVKTTIRPLLLALPAQGFSTNHFFLQIKQEPSNNLLLDYFYITTDATKFALHAAPIKKGKNQTQIQKVMESMMTNAGKAIKNRV